MKLPPATTWPSVGLLCLCSCTLPYFVGEDGVTDASSSSNSTNPGGATTGDDSTPTTSGGAGTAPVQTGTDAGTSDGEAGEGASTGRFDLGTEDFDDFCVDPDAACDADSDDLGHALGLDCDGAGITTLSGLGVAGPSSSRKVVGQLGEEGTYAPRLGSRAVLLSTGVASEVLLTQDELMLTTECSQIGLPCPSTDFPQPFDLAVLPAPMLAAPVVCPEGQPPPGPGDCSQTIDVQWKGEPRLAHDYTELRLTTKVPGGALAVALDAAFFTSEFPYRSDTGAFNDLFVVWLESEPWTGNIAIHPDQQVPMAADVIKFDHESTAPELAGFGFAEHAGTDWVTLTAPVQAGETITLVMALFDVNDGQVDSAVLLDDLRWTCADPSRGAPHH